MPTLEPMGVSPSTGPPSQHQWSFLVISERRTTVSSQPVSDPDSSANPEAEAPTVAPVRATQIEKAEPDPPAVLASSSLTPDEAVVGLSNLLPPDDFRAHQELLKRIAEELKEPMDSLFDILPAPAPPPKVALPIHEGVLRLVRMLW